MRVDLSYTTNPMTVTMPPGTIQLPDEGEWINRYRFTSDSGKKYNLAQDRTTRIWGCSCPGWRFRRDCKHLGLFALGTDPKELTIILREDQPITRRDPQAAEVLTARADRIQSNLESEMIERARAGRRTIIIPAVWDKMLDSEEYQNCYRKLVGRGGRYVTVGQLRGMRAWVCSCQTFEETRGCTHLRELGLPCGLQPQEFNLDTSHCMIAYAPPALPPAGRYSASVQAENRQRAASTRRSDRSRSRRNNLVTPVTEQVYFGNEWNKLNDTREWVNVFRHRRDEFTVGQHKAQYWWVCNCPTFYRQRTCQHLDALGLPGFKREALRVVMDAQATRINHEPALPHSALFAEDDPLPRMVWGMDVAEPGRISETMLRIGHPDASQNGMYVMTPSGWQHLGNIKTPNGWEFSRGMDAGRANVASPSASELNIDADGQLVLDEDDV